jgi:hypothetical protein
MTTRHCEIDTEATRRQFLFAREQLAAHAPGGRARVPQPTRLQSGRPRRERFPERTRPLSGGSG